MQIYSNNLRRTTMEHHRSTTRRYFITPKGAERKIFERKMPKENHVPMLWADVKQMIAAEYLKEVAR